MKVEVCDVCRGRDKLAYAVVAYKFKKPARPEAGSGTISIKFALCGVHKGIFKRAGITRADQLDEAVLVAKAAGVRIRDAEGAAGSGTSRLTKRDRELLGRLNDPAKKDAALDEIMHEARDRLGAGAEIDPNGDLKNEENES